MIWKNSKLACVYYGKDAADENWPCTVKIENGEILVEYDNDGLVQYAGKEKGTGYFELASDQVNGKATLHQRPSSLILEGSWVENSLRGMWLIELANFEADDVSSA